MVHCYVFLMVMALTVAFTSNTIHGVPQPGGSPARTSHPQFISGTECQYNRPTQKRCIQFLIAYSCSKGVAHPKAGQVGFDTHFLGMPEMEPGWDRFLGEIRYVLKPSLHVPKQSITTSMSPTNAVEYGIGNYFIWCGQELSDGKRLSKYAVRFLFNDRVY